MIIQREYFSVNECIEILNLTKENEQIWKSKDRSYKSYQIVLSEKTKWIYEKLKNFFEENYSCKILNINPTLHFHKFEKHDFFDVHNDSNNKRLYGIGLLLNSNFEGGDFIFLEPKNNSIIKKHPGNTYLFDVRLMHKITPIISGERYSILWFLHGDNIEIEHKKIM